MITAKPLKDQSSLADLKRQYLAQTTGPLDGMWLCGFVPMASHYALMHGDDLAGFYCVNDDGYLLQVAIDHRFQADASTIFESGLAGGDGAVKGAFASTAEPLYFSMCLDRFAQFKVNALMYEHNGETTSLPEPLGLRLVNESQLEQAVAHCVTSMGGPREWLVGYLGGLIAKKELFGAWQNGELIATGESRGSHEHQPGYVDVGVVVAPSQRGRGMATRVLQALVARNLELDLRSICSTEKGNKAAQKAIRRAGFRSRNRIVQFDA